MKLTEGTLSHVAAQPHTGLLGILIKHREQLEPGNKITGNAAVQLVALSRAIIEALGGKQVDGRWEVEIGGDAQDIKALADLVGNLHQSVSGLHELYENLEDKYDEKVKALEARIAELEAILNTSPKLNGGDLQGLYENLAGAIRLHEHKIDTLSKCIGQLEQMLAESSQAPITTRKRASKAGEKTEEKPAEPQGE